MEGRRENEGQKADRREGQRGREGLRVRKEVDF